MRKKYLLAGVFFYIIHGCDRCHRKPCSYNRKSCTRTCAETGQTQPYGNRDDGALEMGVAWLDPRFTDQGNGIVIDPSIMTTHPFSNIQADSYWTSTTQAGILNHEALILRFYGGAISPFSKSNDYFVWTVLAN